ADHFAKGNHEEINILYKQVSNRQLYICLLLFIGIWSNLDSLYYFIPNREIYATGKQVVLLIGMGKLFDVVFSVNSEILVFSKHYRFNLIATIGMSVLIIALNYLLIPIYGIDGAAMASAAVMFLYNFVKYLFLKIKLGFDPFSWETSRIILVGITACMPGYLNLFTESPVANMLFTSIAVVLVYWFFSRLLNVGNEEWEWIKNKVKKSGS
ncbi:MAG: polysaccharide biosynthesis C-terminal domain-containing protein, partial [Algoriphagus sp.]